MGCSEIIRSKPYLFNTAVIVKWMIFSSQCVIMFDFLFEVFSRNAENKEYCLSHLFTHQTFENRVVLGLAYIASDRQTSPGGICSIGYYFKIFLVSLCRKIIKTFVEVVV